VTEDDQALSLNPETFDLGWQPVIATVRSTADCMVNFLGPDVDSRVSWDHSMFVNPGDGWQFMDAIDVPDGSLLYGGTLNPDTRESFFVISDFITTVEPVGEEVACISLPEWHTILTKRNHKVLWTGNCRCHWIPVPALQ